MQTILGSGGAIGTQLAIELTHFTDKIRLASRNPKKVNPNDELFVCDLTSAEETDKAVAGSEVCYLTVGLPYNTKVWQESWSKIMTNVIASCKKYNSKLVFFDNVYMYDRNFLNPMTENTPVKPSSKKGEIRRAIADQLLIEMRTDSINALIARSADFISPTGSILIETVYKNFKQGKKASWLLSDNMIHNFTYYKDAAKATALLGNTPDAYGEVWHLPTDRTPMTGKEWIKLLAKEMGVEPRYSVLPDWLLAILSLFVPILKEIKDVGYQYDRHYLFDSSKFEQKFNFRPTKPELAIKELVQVLGK